MTKTIGFGIAGVIVGFVIASVLPGASFGGVYSQVSNTFREGVKVGTTDQFAIDKDGDITTDLEADGDAVINGGSFTLTTSNTATSSAIFGCWQSYATSTETATKLQFTASTTAPTNGSGVIPVISYGTCP